MRTEWFAAIVKRNITVPILILRLGFRDGNGIKSNEKWEDMVISNNVLLLCRKTKVGVKTVSKSTQLITKCWKCQRSTKNEEPSSGNDQANYFLSKEWLTHLQA